MNYSIDYAGIITFARESEQVKLLWESGVKYTLVATKDTSVFSQMLELLDLLCFEGFAVE